VRVTFGSPTALSDDPKITDSAFRCDRNRYLHNIGNSKVMTDI